MSEHLVDSQPKHPDPGMDAFIRHIESEGQEAPQSADPVEAQPAPEALEVEPQEPQEPLEEQPLEPESAPEAEDPDLDPLVPVMVNGAEEHVPLSEMIQGYSRNADYTRKTQALAAERREMEAERVQARLAVQQEAARVSQLADQLERQVMANQPKQEDLDALRITNPAEYAARVADQQRNMVALAQARQQAEVAERAEMATRITTERQALAEKEPAFANDFEGTYAALGRWVTDPNGAGVPVEEWNREVDHRRILIAYQAWKGSEQNAAATDRASSVRAKVAQLPRIRSGARHEPGQTEQANYSAAVDKMKASGTTRDIARALQALDSRNSARGDGNGYP